MKPAKPREILDLLEVDYTAREGDILILLNGITDTGVSIPLAVIQLRWSNYRIWSALYESSIEYSLQGHGAWIDGDAIYDIIGSTSGISTWTLDRWTEMLYYVLHYAHEAVTLLRDNGFVVDLPGDLYDVSSISSTVLRRDGALPKKIPEINSAIKLRIKSLEKSQEIIEYPKDIQVLHRRLSVENP